MAIPAGDQRSGHERALPLRVLVGKLTAAPTLALALVATVAPSACSEEPVYVPSDQAMLAFDPNGVDAGPLGPDPLTLTVPYAVETAEQAAARTQLAADLGLTPDQVPTARRDNTDLEVEWTLTNTSNQSGLAYLYANAANEFFRYVPLAFVTNPDEQQPPPPLMGGRPIMVPAQGSVSGIFNEDQFSEAAQDLDAITRGGIQPGYATLTQWPTKDVTGGTGVLPTIPSQAIPLILRVELTLKATTSMQLQAKLRVRDHSDRLLTDAMDPGMLVAPSTDVFAPPPPPPTQ
jgi:hypothetical protein